MATEKKKRDSYYNLEHQQTYREKTKSVTISFNLENDDDLAIFEHLSKQKSKAGYIKELITKDM